MDKERSIIESLELWIEMAKTGYACKYSVPGPWQNYENCCPLCHYVKVAEVLDCQRCPVLWCRELYCCFNGSPYRRWVNAEKPEKRKKYARQMVFLLAHTLDKFRQKNYNI